MPAPKPLDRTSDNEGNSILYEGANLSQLGILFKVDERVLKQKMYGIQPVGKRYNANIYDVAEVAARMGKMTEAQIDAAMHRLHPSDLPKMITKEYWAGQRSKQEFLLRAGDLWPTSKVVSEVGELIKILKMELDLLTDGIERNTEMTDKQRQVAATLIDGAKTNMMKKLNEKFGKKTAAEPAPYVDDEDDDDL